MQPAVTALFLGWMAAPLAPCQQGFLAPILRGSLRVGQWVALEFRRRPAVEPQEIEILLRGEERPCLVYRAALGIPSPPRFLPLFLAGAGGSYEVRFDGRVVQHLTLDVRTGERFEERTLRIEGADWEAVPRALWMLDGVSGIYAPRVPPAYVRGIRDLLAARVHAPARPIALSPPAPREQLIGLRRGHLAIAASLALFALIALLLPGRTLAQAGFAVGIAGLACFALVGNRSSWWPRGDRMLVWQRDGEDLFLDELRFGAGEVLMGADEIIWPLEGGRLGAARISAQGVRLSYRGGILRRRLFPPGHSGGLDFSDARVSGGLRVSSGGIAGWQEEGGRASAGLRWHGGLPGPARLRRRAPQQSLAGALLQAGRRRYQRTDLLAAPWIDVGRIAAGKWLAALACWCGRFGSAALRRERAAEATGEMLEVFRVPEGCRDPWSAKRTFATPVFLVLHPGTKVPH